MGRYSNRLARRRKVLPTSWGDWEERTHMIGMPGAARGPTGLTRCWCNRWYSVQLAVNNGLEVLMVKRHDARPDFPWRDLQRIKRDLVGPEREAVQVFPRESEIVDVANMAHLWLVPEGERLPYTFRNFGGERGSAC